MRPIIADFIIKKLQKKYFKGKAANSYESWVEYVEKDLPNGLHFRSEIQYSDKYPNSFFDVYYGSKEHSEELPTFINLHGGGYFMGSRVSGDPLTNVNTVGGTMMQDIALEGFNVILADYCLAPEYRYPNQIFQVNELMSFLKERGSEYGLNGENIILMGDSAGATFTAIYGAIISNPEYAKRLGIIPAVTIKQLRGIIVDGSPINTTVMNWGTGVMYKSWFGTCRIKNTKIGNEIRASLWIKKGYPPCFFTAGNDGCWPEDAKEMHEAAKAAGCYTELYIPEIKQGKEGHGYLNNYKTDPLAQEGFERFISFAKQFSDSQRK